MAQRDWGVVQELVVEADTDTALLAAITIAMTYQSRYNHFVLKTEEGSVKLLLKWASDTSKVNAFLSELTTPEEVLAEAKRWLKTAAYGPEPDTDGSTKKGFRVMLRDGWENCLCISPEWIVYGK